MDMQEAMTLELTLPTIVGRALPEPAAKRAVHILRGIGGKAEARLADPEAPLGFELPFPSVPEEVVQDLGKEEPKEVAPIEVDGRDIPSLKPSPELLALAAATVEPSEARKKSSRHFREDGRERRLDDSPPKPEHVQEKPEELPVAEETSGGLGVALGFQAESASDGPKEEGANPRRPRSRPAEGALDLRPPSSRSRLERPSGKISLDALAPKDEASGPISSTPPPRRLRSVAPPVQVARDAEAEDDEGISPIYLVAPIVYLVVGFVALNVSLRRGLSSWLGTADTLGMALDGAALAGGATAVLLLIGMMVSRLRTHGLLLALGLFAVAAGGAYVVDGMRRPAVSASSEVGDEAEGLLGRSDIHFAGGTDASVQELVESARAAGALSVRGAAPVRLFGTTAYHGLAIGLPPGPTVRANIGEAVIASMTHFGFGDPLEVPSEADVWVIPFAGR